MFFINDKFISDYYKRTGIDLNKEPEQFYFVYDTLNRVKDLNNAIINSDILMK